MARAKSKSETSAKIEWSAHCAFLLRDRALWLDDYEQAMLNDNAQGNWEPSDAQREFAKRVAHETEEITSYDDYSVAELIRLAQSCVAELPYEEEEEVAALAQAGCTRVSRRKARRLLAIAKRWAI
jgi:hypothetical protein